MQRFTPRKKKSTWTELNKERVRRLEKFGMMNDAVRAVLPDMNLDNFKIEEHIENKMKEENVWEIFKEFSPLYQRIRTSNITSYKTRNPQMYEKMLIHLIEETKKGKMFGEWNDYGRLLEY